MGLAPGTVFAGYRIERALGAGGMGTVYLARHPRLPRSVALKVLDAEAGEDPEYRARFEREAEITVRLDHPNVVEIYDRGAEDELLWIAMRFVAGADVAHLIQGGMPPRRAVGILAQAAAGLDAAHRRGLLHRDVKPANLLVTEDDDGGDHVFVADFGIARSRDDTHLTAAGELTATLAYVAPEQIEGREPDHRCDIYALGVTFYQMLTGTLPFPGLTPAAVLQAHLLTPPPRPSEKVPGLPPGLDLVVLTALAKNPDDRYPDCRAMAAAAEAALRPSTPHRGPAGHPPPPPHRTASRTAPTTKSTAPATNGPAPQSGSGPHAVVPGGPGTTSSPPAAASAAQAVVPGSRATVSGPHSTPWGPPGPASPGRAIPPPGYAAPSRPPTGPTPTANGRSAGRVTAVAAIAVCLVVVIAVVVVIARSGANSTGTGVVTATAAPPIPPTSTAPPSTTTGPATATPATGQAPVNIAWGRDGALAGLLPGLVPDTPSASGYQGARCADIDVLNNGGAPALECEQSNGIHWYAWSFRPGDPRRDSTFETNIDNATTREESWQRASGTGRVRWTHYTEVGTGLLTVVFDDPDRRWIVIDVSWDGHTGQDLYDQWWSSAPL
ncbi:serine/threonine-protein kinase [Nocardia shimofusensis]|uniref:serine/threonine-protein kinase n=1 Tax=Nocardia shimofusensis TaxID=228596 RepID=UPI00082C9A87|nr:serine/threonine-protein kinase [Nocardia shimofusensis]